MGLLERLYLIRHAETPWNRLGRYQGLRDVPLSRRGRLQRWRLARALARVHLDAVVTSDLRRARDTAAPLARRIGCRLLLEPGLREMSFGRWEGLTHVQVRARFPEEWDAYRRDPVGFAASGGESFLDVAERVSEAWQRAARRAGGRRVAVVAHGAAIKAIVCDLLGVPYEARRRLVLANTGITVFRLDADPPRLLEFNRTCHLEPPVDPGPVRGRKLRRHPSAGRFGRQGPAAGDGGRR